MTWMRAVGDDFRGLGWKYGALCVQRHGAMLAPLTFVLPEGRQISPLHVAPWADAPGAGQLPGILRSLRGEWPCVPFGYSVPGDTAPEPWARLMSAAAPDEEAHGHSANRSWNWLDARRDGVGKLGLFIDYPRTSPVRRLERWIVPDPNAPALDLTLTIEVRDACRLPIGLHPVFRLPAAPGAARIEPAPFAQGRTYPGSVEKGAELFASDRIFERLDAVPGRHGESVDASRVPLIPDSEELLQLNRIDGFVALANRDENYRVGLTWQAEHFPSLLLWYSNRGRRATPWNGRHVALGMEPICSPFGLGPATAIADNPIAQSGTPTARTFAAGEIFTTRYRIEAQALFPDRVNT